MKVKESVPDVCRRFSEKKYRSSEDLLMTFCTPYLMSLATKYWYPQCCKVENNHLECFGPSRKAEYDNATLDHLLISHSAKGQYDVIFGYADDHLNMWSIKCTFTNDKGFSFGKWKCGVAFENIATMNMLQTHEELNALLLAHNPYLFKWAKAHGFTNEKILYPLACPWIEILEKAGYEFVGKIDRYCQSEMQVIQRLCKNGSKPKEIFKTSKAVYTTLKNCTDLKVWDMFRKLDKFGRISYDEVSELYQSGIRINEMQNVYQILSAQFDGKPIFNLHSLMNYLGRVDTYEAIERTEALGLLKDYIQSCLILGKKPVFGDSLKREHDVAARLLRLKKDDVLDAQIRAVANDKMDYKEDVFFIRSIKSYDDLLDEATQQSNSVACYGQMIAKGWRQIFVMREVANPDRSLVTVEYGRGGVFGSGRIIEKRTRFNGALRNKAQSDFLRRWEAWLKMNHLN